MREYKYETKSYYEITEEDFYPAQDDRIYMSNVEDISNGDNYEDYSEYFFSNFENDLFDT